MPAERVSMRKIREVLRLTHALGMSRRLVGEATGIRKTAVGFAFAISGYWIFTSGSLLLMALAAFHIAH